MSVAKKGKPLSDETKKKISVAKKGKKRGKYKKKFLGQGRATKMSTILDDDSPSP